MPKDRKHTGHDLAVGMRVSMSRTAGTVKGQIVELTIGRTLTESSVTVFWEHPINGRRVIRGRAIQNIHKL